MKYIYLSLIFLSFSLTNARAQYFRATLDHEVNWLIVKVQALPAGGDITMELNTFEIFIRNSNNQPDFSFGDIAVNNDDFPDLTNTSFNTALNRFGSESGFNNQLFSYSNSNTPTSMTYTAGTEYEVFRVQVIGADPNDMADFEIVANSSFSPTYVAMIDGGNDLTDTAGNDYFYGDVGTNTGAFGSTTFFESQANVALPIELLSFDVKRVGKQSANIIWESITEINASHYEIQRSSELDQWTTIGKLDAIGNEGRNQVYEYIDSQAANFLNDDQRVYYRLQMVDLDGASEYSEIRFVSFEKQRQISIFPSPARSGDLVTLNLGSNQYGGHILIMAENGKLVKSIPLNEGLEDNTQLQVDIDDRFSSGIYRVISRNTQQQIGQFTVIR